MSIILAAALTGNPETSWYKTMQLMQNMFTLSDDEIREQISYDAVRWTAHEFTKDILGNRYEIGQDFYQDGNDIIFHSVMTAFYSALLSSKITDISLKPDNACITGLFHDIGKKYIPKKIWYKDPFFLSENEKRTLKLHPVYGYNFMFRTYPSAPDEIKRGILQHHDSFTFCNSELAEFSEAACITAIASRYANFITKEKDIKNIRSPDVIFHNKTAYNPEYLNAFIKIIEPE